MGLQPATMATTDIILTPARLTATTDLTGLRVACSSAPARGMAGAGLGAGVAGAGAVLVDAGLSADADLLAGVGSPVGVDSPVAAALRAGAVSLVVRQAAFMVVVASTVAEVEGSMVVAVDTVAVADTANREGTPSCVGRR
jgi:hypothetical protein